MKAVLLLFAAMLMSVGAAATLAQNEAVPPGSATSPNDVAGHGRVRIATTFGVNWSQFLARVASFCIVCLILHRYAYRPVLKMLEARREQIAQGQATGGANRGGAGAYRSPTTGSDGTAHAQGSKFIEEARAAAARVREQETEKAVAAAVQITTNARAAAAQEHDRMLADLKREVGRLVVPAATTVTGKTLTPEDQRRLAEETAKHVAQ